MSRSRAMDHCRNVNLDLLSSAREVHVRRLVFAINAGPLACAHLGKRCRYVFIDARVGHACGLFRSSDGPMPLDRDPFGVEFVRLPECIAADQRGALS